MNGLYRLSMGSFIYCVSKISLMRTRTCAYQEVRNVSFSENFAYLLNEWPLRVFIFQALQYLRKVSNHPSLVLKPTHPEYQEISANLQQAKSPISDIQHSGKLVALR